MEIIENEICRICGKTRLAEAMEWDAPICPEHLESLTWISVNDRLPEIDEDVLTFNGTEVGQDIYTVFDGEHMFYSETVCPEEVTHWMPLPEPPKESE